jgi:hypothetical protein
MLAEMQEKAETNRKEMLARIYANMKSTQEEMKTNQEILVRMEANTEVNLKEMREEIQSGQAEMRSAFSAMEEKMEAAIHSIRSELEDVNHWTQSLQKELTEKIDKTQVELQEVEVSLSAQERKLQDDLATIRSDHLRDYDLTHVMIQATFNGTRSAIEATKREFQARLEVVEARAKQGRGPGVCANAAQLPTFDGTTSWAVFHRQFNTIAEYNHWSYKEKSM